MFNLNKKELDEYAQQNDFIRDTFEKVLRLADILEYFQQNPLTKNTLALKGGTAINLTIFNLPRLSIDIDMDYCAEQKREEMLITKAAIARDIKEYMVSQGYSPTSKGKSYFSLDSFVYAYKNAVGNNDNLKIEINYSLREHLFKPQKRQVVDIADKKYPDVLTLHPMEIFAAKVNALLGRSVIRDLYDTYNLFNSSVLRDFDKDLFRKAIVFYSAVSQENVPLKYDFIKVTAIKNNKIITGLSPVVHKKQHIDLPEMKDVVKKGLTDILVLTKDEKLFLKNFSQKIYTPEILFPDNPQIVSNIKNHPMVSWKMQQRQCR